MIIELYMKEGVDMSELFLKYDDQKVKVDYVTSDLHLSHTNIAKYANRPFDNSVSTYHMDSTLVKNWNKVVEENDTVLCLGDMALGDMSFSIPMYSQMNGLKYLIPGNHDGNSSIMKKRYKKKLDKLAEWEELYKNEFINLPESGVELSIILNDVEYSGFASHYPPYNDGHHGLNNGFPDKFEKLRPPKPKKKEFVLHGHTHTHSLYDTNFKNVFHMGVDAHDLTPVPSEEVVVLFEKYLNN